MTAIGVLHPGEMGSAVAASLIRAGHEVRYVADGRSEASRSRAERAGVVDAGSLGELAASCEVVLSVCPPHAAIDVATAVAGVGFTGTYVDANAIAPATSRRVGEVVAAAGARFVDGGIVGPPPLKAGSTRLYLSGPDAVGAGEVLGTPEVEVHVMCDRIGAASALKLTYAAWTKGTNALLIAIRAAAVAAGVEDVLLDEWRTSQPGLAERSESAAQAGATNGWRWTGEMGEIASMFATCGLPDGFHRAAADIFATLPWPGDKSA